MLPPAPGKIYLADQRGLLATSAFRRYSTFSFGLFQRVHKEPFGRLYGLHEETLAGGYTSAFAVAESSYVVLLPITGAVAYEVGNQASGTVEAEELVTLSVPAGTALRLRNPFADELVSLLHLWVRAPAPLPAAAALPAAFSAQALANQLCELVGAPAQGAGQPLPFGLSLGRFAGRREAVYEAAPGNTLFAFVIAGAFELEGRLLHEKDGLALWDAAELELEALSNHALVLVLELLP
jgi:hypothetical protein